jgi:(2R)-ethylmalonyl-CoA mutase
VVVGGIIPPEDAEILMGKGVARVYTPKDFEIGRIMDDMLGLAEVHRAGLVA